MSVYRDTKTMVEFNEKVRKIIAIKQLLNGDKTPLTRITISNDIFIFTETHGKFKIYYNDIYGDFCVYNVFSGVIGDSAYYEINKLYQELVAIIG